jgi:subtilisin
MVAFAGCSDIPTHAPDADVPAPAASVRYSSPSGDAPWRAMSDQELSAFVQRAGGRVFIGFKEPGATRGVDAQGRPLVGEGTINAAKRDLRSRGLTFEHEFTLAPTVVTRIPAHLVPVLRRLPFVDNVEPILPGEWLSQTIPWNVTRIASPRVWSTTRGAGVKLLMIDSGISAHEDLTWTARTRCIGWTDDDLNGHGTFVAGVIKATNNTIGIVGNASDVSLYSVKVGDSAPDPAATACAVEYGRLQGVFVMTMALSIYNYENLNAQLAAAYAEGRVLVNAAGNTDGGPIVYPATRPEVIAVGATTQWNTRASFSAVGVQMELVAPGDGVRSTTRTSGTCSTGGKYANCSGTSFAAPAVAAVAALVKAANPGFSNVDVRNRMIATATDLGTPGHDTSFGHGLVHAEFAALGQKTVPEHRDWSCYWEQGGYIWESRETWARDWVYYLNGSSTLVGDPYYVGTDLINHGPTAGSGWMPCDYYDGNWN